MKSVKHEILNGVENKVYGHLYRYPVRTTIPFPIAEVAMIEQRIRLPIMLAAQQDFGALGPGFVWRQ